MRDFNNVKRIIIKVGSSSLVNKDLSVNMPMLVNIMNSFNTLRNKNIEVALVTSGAIAVGMHELGLEKKPKEMALKQACAAVGQAKLMESYNHAASIYGIKTGQILINHDDFQIRKRMNHLSDTLEAMFKNGIVPIINENDALAVDEIKVGDNDTLAALITTTIKADLLVLFSDIDGLYTKNPKVYEDAEKIDEVSKIDNKILEMVGAITSDVGTGGMSTKIDAALISTMSGCNMIICNSNRINDLVSIINGENIGTLFIANDNIISSREHWMIFKANSCGIIYIDQGCKEALADRKVSILPMGIDKVDGEFLKGSIIDIRDSNDVLVAKGISAYSSNEIARIMKKSINEIEDILGYKGKKEIIHANDLVLIKENYYGRFIK